jgi:hypothetical protein
VQRPLRHDHAAAAEQVMDLAHREPVPVQPVVDQAVVGDQQAPRLAVAADAVGAHRLDHAAHKLVGELGLAAGADQTQRLRRADLPAHGLSVHARQPLDRSQPLAAQPQTQQFSNLEHPNLPKRHRRPP